MEANGDQANGTNGADLSRGTSEKAKLLWRHTNVCLLPKYTSDLAQLFTASVYAHVPLLRKRESKVWTATV